MGTQCKRLGILVGGGPAPGINSAISATVIEAVNEEIEVIGIYDGYEHLMQGRTDMVRPLTIEEVSRIHFQGGSILRTARANPTRHPDDMQRTLKALQTLGINALALYEWPTFQRPSITTSHCRAGCRPLDSRRPDMSAPSSSVI
jgi:6-phosphofructokinase